MKNTMNEIHNRISRAQEYARNAHAHIIATTVSGVIRPHIVHIQEVADLVWASGGSDDEVVAAWLHDSVEDTEVTLEDIEREFGGNVAIIVEGLTDHGHFKGMQLSERKRLQAERLRDESVSVKRIKIADQTSNVKFLATDPINDMTLEECRNYITGAKLLADECKGISYLLDELFEKVYKAGISRYSDE
jgi:guanosine-3',5'-bis(diphosphate) 3'-pyrophosphohydrolase